MLGQTPQILQEQPPCPQHDGDDRRSKHPETWHCLIDDETFHLHSKTTKSTLWTGEGLV